MSLNLEWNWVAGHLCEGISEGFRPAQAEIVDHREVCGRGFPTERTPTIASRIDRLRSEGSFGRII